MVVVMTDINFKTRMLGRCFHTLIKGVSFFSPTDVRHYNPHPLGPSVIVDTHFFLQSMWDPYQIHPPLGSNVLTGTRSFLQSIWNPYQIHLPLGPSIFTGALPHVYPSSGFSIFVGTRYFLQSMWDPYQIHPVFILL